MPASSLLRKQDLKKTTTKQSRPPEIHELEVKIRELRPEFDASQLLFQQSREAVTDCTITEIVSAFAVKVAPLNRNRNVNNVTGLILSSWTAFFTPTYVAWMRKAVATGPVPQTIAPELTQLELERMLEMMPDHPQAVQWRKSIDALKGEGSR